jgi:hypothetical protein
VSVSVAPNQSAIFTVLRSFLLAIVPAGTEVVQAQPNRVPEPQGVNFVTMNAIRRPRLSTNVDLPADVVFTGSIAGTTLTVTEIEQGAIAVGATVFGTGVAANTTVTAFGSGSGGIGTYTVSPSQTVGSETLAAGSNDITQSADIVIRLNVHGDPANDQSADNAQIISTLFRDEFATSFFAALDIGVSPLYADDPQQVPFENDQSQIEMRWIVDLHLQADQVVVVPQQFASAATVDVISVDATYAP